MAKPFDSMEEVTVRLAKSVDEVKALVRDGKLREFRDAGKVFFKAEDVDKLAGGPAPAAAPPSKSDTGEVVLEAADAEELPTLSDSGTGTSVIGLEPLEEEEPKKPPQKKK